MWTHNLGSGQLWYDGSLQVRAVIEQGVPPNEKLKKLQEPDICMFTEAYQLQTIARYIYLVLYVHRSISVANYS